MNIPSSAISFQELCKRYNLSEDDLWDISSYTGVPKSIIDVMRVGTPVGKADALRVLFATSEKTGKYWTLENTRIPVLIQGLPTFKDVCDLHQVDINDLTQRSNIGLTLIDQMLINHPVDEKDAARALHTLSNMVGHKYSLNNVAMNLASLERVAL